MIRKMSAWALLALGVGVGTYGVAAACGDECGGDKVAKAVQAEPAQVVEVGGSDCSMAAAECPVTGAKAVAAAEGLCPVTAGCSDKPECGEAGSIAAKAPSTVWTFTNAEGQAVQPSDEVVAAVNALIARLSGESLTLSKVAAPAAEPTIAAAATDEARALLREASAAQTAEVALDLSAAQSDCASACSAAKEQVAQRAEALSVD